MDRFQGCLVGLAVGDALGAPVEFCERHRFRPLTDMVSGGKFQMRRGEWTDDTAMALCLAESLLACGGFDASDPWCGSDDPLTSGNGSLMRLAPIPMFYARNRAAAQQFAALSSRTTHGSKACLDACRHFAGLLVHALNGENNKEQMDGADH